MKVANVDINRMLEVASVAARLAGQRAMEEIATTKASIKNNQEIVTQTDSRCQQIIISTIQEAYPNHGFVAEEGDNGKLSKIPPRGEPFWWVIDPIDGTNNYAHKILSFGVSIAVMYQGYPIVGVIFDPATESTFTAFKDGPAQFNNTTMQTSTESINEYASIAVDSHYEGFYTPEIFKFINRCRWRNFGTTAMHMAYVAKGGLIGAIVANAKIWDIAAGALIIERAGGVVTDYEGKPHFPVDLDTYNGGKFNTIASTKLIHSEVVEAIKK